MFEIQIIQDNKDKNLWIWIVFLADVQGQPEVASGKAWSKQIAFTTAKEKLESLKTEYERKGE